MSRIHITYHGYKDQGWVSAELSKDELTAFYQAATMFSSMTYFTTDLADGSKLILPGELARKCHYRVVE